jgi:hypothetical protein
MWNMPWWGVLMLAWGAGSVGFLLAAALSLGKLADEATERIQVREVNGGWELCDDEAVRSVRS